jgi:hypothetical protein
MKDSGREMYFLVLTERPTVESRLAIYWCSSVFFFFCLNGFRSFGVVERTCKLSCLQRREKENFLDSGDCSLTGL